MPYEVDQETGAVLVPLGGRRYPGKIALVDAEDVPLIESLKWRPVCPNQNAPHILYASASLPTGRYVYMHRIILGNSDTQTEVDHINRNGLDNRRANLRIVTHQQNQFNRGPQRTSRSGLKGVSWCKREQRWRSLIIKDNTAHGLGYYLDKIVAARAYDEAARELFGEHAYLNFPEEER